MLSKTNHRIFRFMLLRRISPVCALLVAFLIFFSMLLSSLRSHNASTLNAYRQERLESALGEVEARLTEIDYEQLEILSDRTLNQFVYMYEDLDWYTRFTLQSALQEGLLKLRDHYAFVKSAYLYIPFLGKAVSDLRINVRAEPWLSGCAERENGVFLGDDGQVFNLVLKRDPGDGQVAAVMAVVLDEASIQEQLNYAAVQEADNVAFEWYPAASAQSALYADGASFPIRAVYTADQDGSYTFATQVWMAGMAFLVIVVLMELAGLAQWYMQVYTPLYELLIDAFGQMEQGNLKYRIPLREGSPFSDVYTSYNHMMERMEAYVERDLKQQILVSRANLKQLQSQINPHFMYNSYYILYRLIKRGDREGSMKLAEYLGQFYRYVTRNAGDEKPLREEVDHVRNYAQIQKIRFQDALDVQIDEPDEEIAQICVPRLILQPLVENAFKYAYDENPDERMRLLVRFEVESPRRFDIIVENSGDIQPQTLEAIRDRLQSNDEGMETTALVNIHRRLQVYFGGASALRVDRSPLGGLRVCMHIEDAREEGCHGQG